LVLGSRKSKEVKTSLVYLAPKGEEGPEPQKFLLLPKERKGGIAPKVSEETGLDHGLLYAKVLAGFQARSLAQKSSRMTFQATSLKPEI
jgi:hypothetical protein